MADLKYFIELDGESIPLEASTTIGRHLDNDLVVAGEDVLDFHLRVEPTDRGPRVFPLGEASLNLDGVDCDEPVGVVVGDRIEVGQNLVAFKARPVEPQEAEEWWLHADREESIYKITGTLNAGRGDDNEILIIDDHVSRHHARLTLAEGVVWLKDLGSANGTYVNGEKLTGGCRLYHGDEIAFDTLRFQLIGKGGDLTGVRRMDTEADGMLIKDLPQSGPDTTEFAPAEPAAEVPAVIPDSAVGGPCLVGMTDPVQGRTFRTGMGVSVIGRDEDCDVTVVDQTVSTKHAEIMVRAESITVTNLMATNGTRVNGKQIQSATLNDGDVLRVGRVDLLFKNIPTVQTGRPPPSRPQLLGIAAAGIALIAFTAWILL